MAALATSPERNGRTELKSDGVPSRHSKQPTQSTHGKQEERVKHTELEEHGKHGKQGSHESHETYGKHEKQVETSENHSKHPTKSSTDSSHPSPSLRASESQHSQRIGGDTQLKPRNNALEKAGIVPPGTFSSSPGSNRSHRHHRRGDSDLEPRNNALEKAGIVPPGTFSGSHRHHLKRRNNALEKAGIVPPGTFSSGASSSGSHRHHRARSLADAETGARNDPRSMEGLSLLQTGPRTQLFSHGKVPLPRSSDDAGVELLARADSAHGKSPAALVPRPGGRPGKPVPPYSKEHYNDPVWLYTDNPSLRAPVRYKGVAGKKPPGWPVNKEGVPMPHQSIYKQRPKDKSQASKTEASTSQTEASTSQTQPLQRRASGSGGDRAPGRPWNAGTTSPVAVKSPPSPSASAAGPPSSPKSSSDPSASYPRFDEFHGKRLPRKYHGLLGPGPPGHKVDPKAKPTPNGGLWGTPTRQPTPSDGSAASSSSHAQGGSNHPSLAYPRFNEFSGKRLPKKYHGLLGPGPPGLKVDPKARPTPNGDLWGHPPPPAKHPTPPGSPPGSPKRRATKDDGDTSKSRPLNAGAEPFRSQGSHKPLNPAAKEFRPHGTAASTSHVGLTSPATQSTSAAGPSTGAAGPFKSPKGRPGYKPEHEMRFEDFQGKRLPSKYQGLLGPGPLGRHVDPKAKPVINKSLARGQGIAAQPIKPVPLPMTPQQKGPHRRATGDGSDSGKGFSLNAGAEPFHPKPKGTALNAGAEPFRPHAATASTSAAPTSKYPTPAPPDSVMSKHVPVPHQQYQDLPEQTPEKYAGVYASAPHGHMPGDKSVPMPHGTLYGSVTKKQLEAIRQNYGKSSPKGPPSYAEVVRKAPTGHSATQKPSSRQGKGSQRPGKPGKHTGQPGPHRRATGDGSDKGKSPLNAGAEPFHPKPKAKGLDAGAAPFQPHSAAPSTSSPSTPKAPTYGDFGGKRLPTKYHGVLGAGQRGWAVHHKDVPMPAHTLGGKDNLYKQYASRLRAAAKKKAALQPQPKPRSEPSDDEGNEILGRATGDGSKGKGLNPNAPSFQPKGKGLNPNAQPYKPQTAAVLTSSASSAAPHKPAPAPHSSAPAPHKSAPGPHSSAPSSSTSAPSSSTRPHRVKPHPQFEQYPGHLPGKYSGIMGKAPSGYQADPKAVPMPRKSVSVIGVNTQQREQAQRASKPEIPPRLRQSRLQGRSVGASVPNKQDPVFTGPSHHSGRFGAVGDPPRYNDLHQKAPAKYAGLLGKAPPGHPPASGKPMPHTTLRGGADNLHSSYTKKLLKQRPKYKLFPRVEPSGDEREEVLLGRATSGDGGKGKTPALNAGAAPFQPKPKVNADPKAAGSGHRGSSLNAGAAEFEPAGPSSFPKDPQAIRKLQAQQYRENMAARKEIHLEQVRVNREHKQKSEGAAYKPGQPASSSSATSSAKTHQGSSGGARQREPKQKQQQQQPGKAPPKRRAVGDAADNAKDPIFTGKLPNGRFGAVGDRRPSSAGHRGSTLNAGAAEFRPGSSSVHQAGSSSSHRPGSPENREHPTVVQGTSSQPKKARGSEAYQERQRLRRERWRNRLRSRAVGDAASNARDPVFTGELPNGRFGAVGDRRPSSAGHRGSTLNVGAAEFRPGGSSSSAHQPSSSSVPWPGGASVHHDEEFKKLVSQQHKENRLYQKNVLGIPRQRVHRGSLAYRQREQPRKQGKAPPHRRAIGDVPSDKDPVFTGKPANGRFGAVGDPKTAGSGSSHRGSSLNAGAAEFRPGGHASSSGGASSSSCNTPEAMRQLICSQHRENKMHQKLEAAQSRVNRQHLKQVKAAAAKPGQPSGVNKGPAASSSAPSTSSPSDKPRKPHTGSRGGVKVRERILKAQQQWQNRKGAPHRRAVGDAADNRKDPIFTGKPSNGRFGAVGRPTQGGVGHAGRPLNAGAAEFRPGGPSSSSASSPSCNTAAAMLQLACQQHSDRNKMIQKKKLETEQASANREVLKAVIKDVKKAATAKPGQPSSAPVNKPTTASASATASSTSSSAERTWKPTHRGSRGGVKQRERKLRQQQQQGHAPPKRRTVIPNAKDPAFTGKLSNGRFGAVGQPVPSGAAQHGRPLNAGAPAFRPHRPLNAGAADFVPHYTDLRAPAPKTHAGLLGKAPAGHVPPADARPAAHGTVPSQGKLAQNPNADDWEHKRIFREAYGRRPKEGWPGQKVPLSAGAGTSSASKPKGPGHQGVHRRASSEGPDRNKDPVFTGVAGGRHGAIGTPTQSVGGNTNDPFLTGASAHGRFGAVGQPVPSGAAQHGKPLNPHAAEFRPQSLASSSSTHPPRLAAGSSNSRRPPIQAPLPGGPPYFSKKFSHIPLPFKVEPGQSFKKYGKLLPPEYGGPYAKAPHGHIPNPEAVPMPSRGLQRPESLRENPHKDGRLYDKLRKKGGLHKRADLSDSEVHARATGGEQAPVSKAPSVASSSHAPSGGAKGSKPLNPNAAEFRPQRLAGASSSHKTPLHDIPASPHHPVPPGGPFFAKDHPNVPLKYPVKPGPTWKDHGEKLPERFKGLHQTPVGPQQDPKATIPMPNHSIMGDKTVFAPNRDKHRAQKMARQHRQLNPRAEPRADPSEEDELQAREPSGVPNSKSDPVFTGALSNGRFGAVGQPAPSRASQQGRPLSANAAEFRPKHLATTTSNGHQAQLQAEPSKGIPPPWVGGPHSSRKFPDVPTPYPVKEGPRWKDFGHRLPPKYHGALGPTPAGRLPNPKATPMPNHSMMGDQTVKGANKDHNAYRKKLRDQGLRPRAEPRASTSEESSDQGLRARAPSGAPDSKTDPVFTGTSSRGRFGAVGDPTPARAPQGRPLNANAAAFRPQRLASGAHQPQSHAGPSTSQPEKAIPEPWVGGPHFSRKHPGVALPYPVKEGPRWKDFGHRLPPQYHGLVAPTAPGRLPNPKITPMPNHSMMSDKTVHAPSKDNHSRRKMFREQSRQPARQQKPKPRAESSDDVRRDAVLARREDLLNFFRDLQRRWDSEPERRDVSGAILERRQRGEPSYAALERRWNPYRWLVGVDRNGNAHRRAEPALQNRDLLGAVEERKRGEPSYAELEPRRNFFRWLAGQDDQGRQLPQRRDILDRILHLGKHADPPAHHVRRRGVNADLLA